MGLLRFNLLAEFDHHSPQLGDQRLGVRQLLAKIIRVVGRRHALFNTTPRSG